jgi:hypothetical protein
MTNNNRETKRRPIALYEEEKPHLLALPAQPYDTARVLYRTVDSEGHVAWLQNFYSVPWQRIGELLPVRVTENELIVYGPDIKEIARHELFPSGVSGQKHSLPEHSPATKSRSRWSTVKCGTACSLDSGASALSSAGPPLLQRSRCYPRQLFDDNRCTTFSRRCKSEHRGCPAQLTQYHLAPGARPLAPSAGVM